MAASLFSLCFFGIESASPSLHQTRDQSSIPLAFNVLVCVRRIPVGMRYTKEQITDIWVPKLCIGHTDNRNSYPCNRPWRPIRLWDVEAATFSRQSAHRWRWGSQPYAPSALYTQEDSWYSFLLETESTPSPIMRLEGLSELKNPIISSGIESATFRPIARCVS
jgi:hypothetical protein